MRRLIPCSSAVIVLLGQAALGQVPTFTDIRGSSGTAGGHSPYGNGTAFGDIDGDGCIDLYVATTTGGDHLFLNHCDLTFHDVRSPMGIDGQNHCGVAFGDFDNDGLTDLLVTGVDDSVPARLYRNLGGLFQDVGPTAFPSTAFGYHAVWADLDRDGFLDVVASRRILRNQGDGTFSDVSGPSNVVFLLGARVHVSDTDNDGDLDILLIQPRQCYLYRNDSGLTFTDVTALSGLADAECGGADFGDIDNDGDLDLYISLQGTNSLFRNDGDNHFADISETCGCVDTGPDTGLGRGSRSAAFGDIDNDGLLDIYVSNYKQGNTLYLNNGDYTFTDVTSATGTGDGGAGHGLAFGDIDNDGDLEVYVANSEGTNPLYLNNGTSHNWIEIRLVGVI